VRRPDRVIAREVRAKLSRTAALSRMPLRVRVERGVVELTGSVTSWEQQQLAEQVARAVPGVRFCQNQLTASARIPRTAAILAADVETRLDWDPLLQHADIRVVARGTTVELQGVVASASRHRRAVRQAWVKDVRAVDAHQLLVLAEPAPLDHFRHSGPTDLEIQAAISDLASYWPQVSFTALSIAVSGGVVTLRGNVPTLAEKRAAEELARSAVGVVELKSELRGPWWRPPPASPSPPPRRPVRRPRRR
jgi:osmotically-inducible protein OsmY